MPRLLKPAFFFLNPAALCWKREGSPDASSNETTQVFETYADKAKDIQDWVVNGESTEEVKTLAEEINRSIEEIKNNAQEQRDKEYVAIFDEKIAERGVYDCPKFTVEQNDSFKDKGMFEMLIERNGVLRAQFADYPELKALAYGHVYHQMEALGVDANVVPFGSTIEMVDGKITFTLPDGKSAQADLFPWEIRDAVQQRLEKAKPAPQPTEPADEPKEPADEPKEPADEPKEPADEPKEPERDEIFNEDWDAAWRLHAETKMQELRAAGYTVNSRPILFREGSRNTTVEYKGEKVVIVTLTPTSPKDRLINAKAGYYENIVPHFILNGKRINALPNMDPNVPLNTAEALDAAARFLRADDGQTKAATPSENISFEDRKSGKSLSNSLAIFDSKGPAGLTEAQTFIEGLDARQIALLRAVGFNAIQLSQPILDMVTARETALRGSGMDRSSDDQGTALAQREATLSPGETISFEDRKSGKSLSNSLAIFDSKGPAGLTEAQTFIDGLDARQIALLRGVGFNAIQLSQPILDMITARETALLDEDYGVAHLSPSEEEGARKIYGSLASMDETDPDQEKKARDLIKSMNPNQAAWLLNTIDLYQMSVPPTIRDLLLQHQDGSTGGALADAK